MSRQSLWVPASLNPDLAAIGSSLVSLYPVTAPEARFEKVLNGEQRQKAVDSASNQINPDFYLSPSYFD